MLPTKFGVNGLLGLGEKVKNRLSRWLPWWPSWISDWHDFSYLIYKSPRCFLANLELIDLLVQEKKRKIEFHDGSHGGHLGFPIGTNLAFLIYKSPRCFLASLESTGLSVQEKKQKIDFQDGGHLGLRSERF